MSSPHGESVPLAKVLPQTSVLYDVGARGIARVYAEALLKTAAQAGQADEVLEELISLVEDVCAKQPEFESFLLNPAVSRDRKAEALNKIGEKANPIFLNFLQVLNRHERLSILRPLVLECRLLHLEMKGQQAVTVRTAVPMADDQRDRLIHELRQTMAREPLLVMIVDPDMIGGLSVRIGDWLFDASVRTQLNNIRSQLFERSVMRFKPDEIVSVLIEEIKETKAGPNIREVGRVLEVGDGIARVYGLAGVMAGEMLEFSRTGVRGLAFNLEENSVGVIILGDYLDITEGDEVKTTGALLRVPCGDALIGRVVDPLGNPLDGKGPIVTPHSRPVESMAPGVAGRQPVNQPLQTGIKAIDSMTPIGRGQRELIIGDRKTGKTAIAVDAIINQKGENVVCVYVAIGQKESTVAQVVEALQAHGAMDYTIVVVTSARDPAPLQYIAPYAGCAMVEYFMYEFGKDTLCVYDDLTKQAAAYRQLSLLMRRPPGREAYPGDVFYAHSRLLERSAKLAERYVIVPDAADASKVTDDMAVNRTPDGKPVVYVGPLDRHHAQKNEVPKHPGHKLAKVWNTGGSQTALPIIETLEGEVSAYIPTNVISITDGQIYLQPDLFFAGVRPAIDVGISVSRVGGKAQIPAMKSIAGSLRLDLASFRELEAFAQLGTDLDKATQAQLDRGYRMVEVLKQPQYQPMNVIDQVMVIYAGTKGFLDKVDRKQVLAWEKQFALYMKEQRPGVREALAKERKLTPDIEKQLTAAITDFQPQFKPV